MLPGTLSEYFDQVVKKITHDPEARDELRGVFFAGALAYVNRLEATELEGGDVGEAFDRLRQEIDVAMASHWPSYRSALERCPAET